MKTISYLFLAAVFLFPGAVQAKEISADSLAGLPNAGVLEEGVLVGGAPTPEALAEVKKRGVDVVIDLRIEPDKIAAEEKIVKDLGMTYHSIPVSSPNAIGPEQIKALDAVLAVRGDQGVLLHCATGRRANALWEAYKKSK